jgi:hypothetical protein
MALFFFQSEYFLCLITADIAAVRWVIAVFGATKVVHSPGSDNRLLRLKMGWHQRVLTYPQKLERFCRCSARHASLRMLFS